MITATVTIKRMMSFDDEYPENAFDFASINFFEHCLDK
jgi:hypothetical protein